MRIRGKTSHCDTEPLAGQRKADSGKDGVLMSVSAFESWKPFPSPFLTLRRGLWWRPDGVPAITKLGATAMLLNLVNWRQRMVIVVMVAVVVPNAW